MRTSASLVLLAAFAAHGFLAVQGAACPIEPAGMGVLLPWYVHPSNLFANAALAAYGPRCAIHAIVTGDSSGPPTNNMATYSSAFKELADSGIRLYGYVHTMADVAAHQARPVTVLVAEVAAWYDSFGAHLTGIFFDEVDASAANVAPLSFYADLADAVQQRGGRVLFNPGTAISCDLAVLSDVYVRFEDTAAQWSTAYAAGARCDCGQQSACALLLHSQPAAATSGPVTTLVEQAVRRDFSYVFVTDRVMPNPWDGLPSNFATLLDTVAPEEEGQASPSPRPPSPQPLSPRPPSPRPPSPRPPAPATLPVPSSAPTPTPSSVPTPTPSSVPSPTPTPSSVPTPTPSQAPQPQSQGGGVWRPTGPVKWQWQLSGEDFKPMLRTRPEVIDVDVDQVAALLQQAQQLGVARSSFKLICYFSVGTYEPGRVETDNLRNISWPDLERRAGGSGGAAAGGQVPGPLYLEPMDGPFSEERWLSIDLQESRELLVREVMVPRMRSAVAAGCDAIEMDNVDAYGNVPPNAARRPRGVTLEHQLAFNAALLDAAHSLGLSAGLKNSMGLLGEKFADGRSVADEYDWFLNERCWEFAECQLYAKYVKRPVSVMGVEYCDSVRRFGSGSALGNMLPDCVCPLANAYTGGSGSGGVALSWLIKTVDLGAVGLDCREYCGRPGVKCGAPTGVVSKCRRKTPKDVCPLYGVTNKVKGRKPSKG